MPKHPWSRVMIIVVPAIHIDDAWPMVRDEHSVAKLNHFRKIYRSIRSRMVHSLEQEPDQYQEEEDHIDTVKINSINFNSKCSVVIANLKTSSRQVRIIVQCKVDTGSDWNILSLHIYKKIISYGNKRTTGGNRFKRSIQLKAYNRTTITPSGICKVKKEHKHKICNFFVVTGNRQTVLGMADIKTLDILTIKCNKVDTQKADRGNAVQTQPTARVQGVSNTTQTWCWKAVDPKMLCKHRQ